MDLDDVDLFDLDAFQREEHHAMFKVLRAQDPVHHSLSPNGTPLWHLTKLDDVREVNRDPGLFSSEVDGVTLHNAMREESDGEDMGAAMNGHMMLTTDPPKHTRYRRLVSKGFTPRMINRLEELLAWRSSRIVDQVIGRGECELVEGIASELPLQAIADFVGVPQCDRRKMFDWSNAMIGADDPAVSNPEAATAAAAELYMYSRYLVDEKKKCPADDIFSVLVGTQAEPDGLSDTEIDLFFMLMAVAGNETTRNATAHGVLALLQHPEQMQKLQSTVHDDDKFLIAIDEMVRWGTPVTHFSRTATADTEIRGRQIKANDTLVLWHASANRDEEAFDQPEVFDIERFPNEHTSFGGGGAHFCLGANLARIELKLIIREIVTRMPDLELDGEVVRLRSNFIHGINKLPVRFTPGPQLDRPAPEGIDPAFL